MLSRSRKRMHLSVVMLISLVISIPCYSATILKIMVEGDLPKQLITLFEKSHKNVKIELISISPNEFNQAINQKPDLYIGMFANGVNSELFQDLAKLVPTTTIKSYIPELLNAFVIRGKLLGLPIGCRFTQLEFNNSMFKEAGLETPNETWTWEGKFYETCKKLTKDIEGDGLIDRYGIVGLPAYTNYECVIFSYGGTFTDTSYKKITYTEKPAMDAINFLIKLHKNKLTDSRELSQLGTSFPFLDGKSGMCLSNATADSPSRVLAKLINNSPLKFEVELATIPSGPKGGIPAARTSCISIFKTSKNIDQAIEFAKFLTSLTAQQIYFDFTKEFPTTYEGLKYKRITALVTESRLKSLQRSKAIIHRQDVSTLLIALWEDIYKIVTGQKTLQDLILKAKDRERSLLK